MLNQTKKRLLYLYILGQNNNHDTISTPVPYRINDEEIFYGPCKKLIREELRRLFPSRDIIDPEKENYEIYLVGINPTKDTKEDKIFRYFLFAGKIRNIFTFEYAWKYYNIRRENDTNIVKMINGIENFSPLHLEPLYDRNNGKFIGYKHRTDEHKDNWLKDILSQNEINQLNQEEINKIYSDNEILLKDPLKFERDCCFSLENIFFSYKNNPNPIPLDDRLLSLIVIGLKNPKGADLKSPFGYAKNSSKYGRGHVKITGDGVTEFINILYEKLNKIKN